MSPVLEVADLRVELEGLSADVVDEVCLRVGGGKIFGLVGESGSGKTTVSLAVLGHCRSGVRIAGGSIRVEDEDILSLPPSELRRRRGGQVSYVPQDPSSALNPSLTVLTQLRETLTTHGWRRRSAATSRRVSELAAELRLPSTRGFWRSYPHQLSGGQQQRVALAMAFACRPRLIVLDEPTTGLDVTTQAHILSTIGNLCESYGAAALYVTHDLAVVATIADEVGVMYAGRLVEQGSASTVLTTPAHPYTQRLVEAVPTLGDRRPLQGIPGRAPPPGARPTGCFYAPRCEFVHDECAEAFPPTTHLSQNHAVRCFRAEAIRLSPGQISAPSATQMTPGHQAASQHTPRPVARLTDLRASYEGKPVLHGVSLDLHAGECLALVGESGSGKTTLSKCVAGLHAEYTGELEITGHRVEHNRRLSSVRRTVQYVFQDPYSSLNPRRTVGDSIAQPLRHFTESRQPQLKEEVMEALRSVALGPGALNRYPSQLSGGERQRVAIARALVVNPSMLICDEITSSLDVSVQASIIQLLVRLREQRQMAILFVTHNLALMRSIAGRVAVMHDGNIVETGPTEKVLADRGAPETQRLLADIPHFPAATAEHDARQDEGATHAVTQDGRPRR